MATSDFTPQSRTQDLSLSTPTETSHLSPQTSDKKNLMKCKRRASVVRLSVMASTAAITEVDVSSPAVVVMPVDKCSEILWSVQPLEVIPASHNLTLDSQPRALAFALAK